MNHVQEAADTLIAEIEACTEYQRYQNAKKTLYRYPVLKEKTDEFRKKNFEIQNSGADLLDEGENLRRQYAHILENPIVMEYLNAENAMCRLLRHLNWQLLQKLDLEGDFQL